MNVVDCRKVDCRPLPRAGGCAYYARSVSCYWLDDGQPHDCATSGVTPSGDRLACMDAACAAVETAFTLEPIEERIVDVRATFPDRRYPETAQVGLYRVVDKRRRRPRAGRRFR